MKSTPWRLDIHRLACFLRRGNHFVQAQHAAIPTLEHFALTRGEDPRIGGASGALFLADIEDNILVGARIWTVVTP